MNLVLYSVFNKNAIVNFENNVLNGISKNKLKSNLLKREYELVNDIDEEFIKFWGCKDTKYYIKKIERIKRGDIIMFAKNKQFSYIAEVVDVIKSKTLGDYLFNDKIYSNVIILKNIKNIKISYEDLFNELGYNSKLKINGLFLVSEDRIENFLKKHGNINNYIKMTELLPLKVL